MSKVILSIDVSQCVFKERINRFTALIYLERVGLVRAHITNTGRLSEFLVPGNKCLAYAIDGAKLKYRLASVYFRDVYAVIDTILQSRAFEESIYNGLLPWMKDCKLVRRNPRVNKSILDYMASCKGKNLYIELKSAVLAGSNMEAMYPDCPTERGRRHIGELVDLLKRGLDSMLVMVAGFKGARCFKPYREGDPMIYEVLSEALRRGLNVKSFSIYMDFNGRVTMDNPDVPLCSDWVSEVMLQYSNY